MLEQHQATAQTARSWPARLWRYQAERFPVVGHGALVAAFSLSALCYAALLRGTAAWPSPGAIAVAFASAFLFFLLLRIADEFKDFDEDCRYRPYRPVPRGLVTLPELGRVGAAAALLQLGLAWWLEPRLIPLLLLVWSYLALMSKEFFVRRWLKAHPIVYLWSHMLIVPLIDFYVMACDWLAAGQMLPHGQLIWFLIVSFCNGVVIELGRKIRVPRDEEPGVETYSALWGHKRAALVWLGALLLTAAAAQRAAVVIGFGLPISPLLGLGLMAAAAVALRFLRRPATPRAQHLETVSGLWTLLMYLSLGVLPLLLTLAAG